MTEDYGKVEHNGKILRLTQNPYIDGWPGMETFTAQAEDDDGNIYAVTWDINEEWNERDEEDDYDDSDACDWHHPSEVVMIEAAE